MAGRGRRVPPRPRRVDPPSAFQRVRDREPGGDSGAAGCRDASRLRLRKRGLGQELARRGDLGGTEAVSAPPAPPLLLASTSPQRRAILGQLGIPFSVVAPRYAEDDREDADAVALVREHALGKARSVAGEAGDRPVLAVDTAVVLDGRVYGKPADTGDAERMLEALGGRTHVVVSGLCL